MRRKSKEIRKGKFLFITTCNSLFNKFVGRKNSVSWCSGIQRDVSQKINKDQVTIYLIINIIFSSNENSLHLQNPSFRNLNVKKQNLVTRVGWKELQMKNVVSTQRYSSMNINPLKSFLEYPYRTNCKVL